MKEKWKKAKFSRTLAVLLSAALVSQASLPVLAEESAQTEAAAQTELSAGTIPVDEAEPAENPGGGNGLFLLTQKKK